MQSRLISLALLASAALASKEEYRRFADVMAKYGYTWEPVKVTTEDGFILTVFHVTGNSLGAFRPTLPPVLIMHGDLGDGAQWLGD